MSSDAQAGGGAWHALTQDALLAFVHRGDARHALRLLLAALARRLQGRCELTALQPGGQLRWQESASPGLSASVAPGEARRLELPLQRLGRVHGLLSLSSAEALTPEALQPVGEAMAALLAHDEGAAAAPERPGYVEAVRSALRGGGTFVWEWDIDNDRLSDIDEGLQQLGYVDSEVGRTQADWDALMHPEDVEGNLAAYRRHARGEVEQYEHAYRIRAKNGEWRWFQERGRIVERHTDGRPRRMVGTQTDITQQRGREQAAAQAAARLERIAAHVPGILYQFELDAQLNPRFPYISERARTLLGLDPQRAAASAMELMDRIDPVDREGVTASIVESAHKLSQWQWEFRVQTEPDTLRWIRAVSTPKRLDDGSTVWHGYMQDVTELRALERDRREKAAAQAANRAKTEFLSRMSHELRTPLNAVLGFAQLLEMDRNDGLSEGQRRRVRLIRESGEHLLRMIGDLLDLTRIESGNLQVQIDAVPLQELAEEVIEMLRPQAEAAQVRVALQLGSPDLRAEADRSRLRQVLLNLLSNAIKYNRPGGRADIDIAAAPPADGRAWLQLSVRDNGLGIAEADLPHLFEPFNRLAQAHGHIEGTGIGLSVTRALVTLMRGQMQVESRSGEGSSFGVRLPQA